MGGYSLLHIQNNTSLSHLIPYASSYTFPVFPGVAAVIEIMSEPFYIMGLVNLQFKLRVVVDTLSLMTKSLVTLALVSRTAVPPALAFSFAQLGFAGVTLLGYGVYGISQLSKVGLTQIAVQQHN